MACLITAGVTPTGCDQQSAGILKDKIWVFNASEITAYTETTPGEISALTLVALTTGFKIDVHRNTAMASEELVTGANSGDSYTQSLTFRIIDDSTSTRNNIDALKGADLVFVVKKKNGKFVILGQGEGLRLTENPKTTGAVAGDDVGDVLTFSGDGFENKFRYFFDTSEATTEVTLDSYL